MEVITVKPHEAWDFFKSHREELQTTMRTIAYNNEFGTVIYMTTGDDGMPEIVVFMDDTQVYEEPVANSFDMRETVEEIYDKYLTSRAVSSAIEDEDEQMAQDMEIEEREDELDSAFIELLDILLKDDYYAISGEFGDIADDLKEHICEYLYTEHGVSIYRPMYLEDEDGKEFFEEYPYDCMDFDEE